jgi:transposase
MKPPVRLRTLTEKEAAALAAGLRSKSAFTLKRCQILTAHRAGKAVQDIAAALHCGGQTVRRAIHAFNGEGVAALTHKSHANHTSRAVFDQTKAGWLLEAIHKSPRTFGKETSLWTTGLLAVVACEQGLTQSQVDPETIRLALKRLGVNWKRAKKRIQSPDGAYTRKKTGATG